MSFVPLLQQGGVAGPQSLLSVAPFLLIIVIFYFFLIRPQNKKQKETQKMIDALKKGDKVVTIGGIHGIVSATKEKTIIVKVDEGVKIEFNRSAIAGVVSDKPANEKSEKKAKSESEHGSSKSEESAESSESENK